MFVIQSKIKNQKSKIAKLIFSALILTAAATLAGESAPPTKATEAVAIEDEAAILKKLKERTARDKALEKGVIFLLSQQKADGAFSNIHPTAMTGLALMALMAVGHTPDDPTHGPAIRRGLKYVLSQMRDDGYLGHNDQSRMYGHGICTLMLAEAVGMTRDEMLERRLIEGCKRAVKLILNAQDIRKSKYHQGGWRYEPNSTDSDLSLSGWQTMALRSAKNIGIDVPNMAIQAAIAYIRSHAQPDGNFAYVDHDQIRPGMRGIGLLVLPICGVYDAPELVKGTAKMLADPPKWQGEWFYYRVYYASASMYQMGDQAWNRFYPIVDDLLIKHQNADGSWPDPPNNEEIRYTKVYTTALATLALAVHYNLLPCYQR
ncbi:MAG: prenyltransferase/squalene oxidase repeat-containing protein [Planctomycetota bacterium]